jgi:hypothetical protein
MKAMAAFALLAFIGMLGILSPAAAQSGVVVFDRGDNALWMRRHWMHEAPAVRRFMMATASWRP